MTITANDLKLFAAAYPDDTATGGGRMTATVVQNGVENNVFPDIDAAARASGRVQLRKVFFAVTSNTADTLMAAQASFAAGSSDAGVDVVAFLFGDAATLRPQAVSALQSSVFATVGFSGNAGLAFLYVSGNPYQVNMLTSASAPPVGALVTIGGHLVTWVTASSGSTVTFADPVPGYGSSGSGYLYVYPASAWLTTTNPVIGSARLTATSEASSVRIDRVLGRIVPAMPVFPTVVNGLSSPSGLEILNGRVPIFRPGDSVVIRNGSTSEVANVTAVDYTGGLTFSSALANSYPAGSVVSSLLQLGDLQAGVGASFTQQTWTRSWSDSILGNPIGLSYNTIAGSISATNIGAETERWAIVFTSSTAFNLQGEHVGQIASGTTGADFSPLNPITNAPYFTIAAAGWGSGWAIGNVLRFNTTGARAPVWIARCVSPSPAGSVNTPSLEVRGSVNA